VAPLIRKALSEALRADGGMVDVFRRCGELEHPTSGFGGAALANPAQESPLGFA
jgi:hypothetical protein